MDDQNRILDKLDKLEEKSERRHERMETRLVAVERELVIYNEQLKHHIAGVQQLKQENELLREYIDNQAALIQEQIAPMEKTVVRVRNLMIFTKKAGNYFFSLLGLISLITGIIYSLMQIRGK